MSNPLARRNRRAPQIASRLRALLDGDGELASCATHDELEFAAERFKARGIELLGVNGGDGTGHLVLTAFVRSYGDAPLPSVALLRAGAMNTVADAHKCRGSPESILKTLLERRRAGIPLRTVERDLLVVETDGAPPRYGFLFGTGAVVAFLDAYYRTGHPCAAIAALLLVRTVTSALVAGRFSASLAQRQAMRIATDGDEWPDGPYLCLLAGTVPEIGFGFTPLSRCDEQPGFFHAVGVTGSALRIAAHFPHIWLGLPWHRALAVDAVSRDLTVEGPLRFALDGEIYQAQESVRVRTGPAVSLVIP